MVSPPTDILHHASSRLCQCWPAGWLLSVKHQCQGADTAHRGALASMLAANRLLLRRRRYTRLGKRSELTHPLALLCIPREALRFTVKSCCCRCVCMLGCTASATDHSQVLFEPRNRIE